jgi:uncharacterized membrane protein YoaK (UPF0700 family)
MKQLELRPSGAKSSVQPSSVRHLRQALVLLLSCAAGGVDAASYVGLGHVFAANMTGNSVHLGMAIGRVSAVDAGHSASALLGFLLGAAAGAAIVERDDSTVPWPRAVTVALSAELVLLGAVALAWRGVGTQQSLMVDAFLIALGVAMGMQSIAIVRLRIPGVASTYLTGTLTSLMAGLIRRASGKQAPTPEAPTHSSALLALVWVVYVSGAALTTLAARRGGPLALLLPMVLIAIVLAGADREGGVISGVRRRGE